MSTSQPQGQPLPQVALATPLAAEVADLASIRADLDFAAAACARIRETLADEPTIEHEALWKAALIAYRRAFNGGKGHLRTGRSRMKVPIGSWVQALGDQAVAAHGDAMEMGNRHVAHQVNNAEQAKVVVMLDPPPEEPGIARVGTAVMKLQVATELLPRLEGLAGHLSQRLSAEIDYGLRLVTEQATEHIGLDELYRQAAKNT